MRKRQTKRWEMMDKSKTDLAVLIKHFEVHNKTEGKSPRTVEWYNEVLGLLLRWLQESDKPTELGFLDEMVIRQFVMYLQEKPGSKGNRMSSHSIYNRVNALRSFFGWLYDKDYTGYHVLQDMKQPKTAEVIIEPLTQEEMDAVFSAMDVNTALGARNMAIVSLMLDTGLRLSEVAALKERDVHLESQYLKVMGKGSKERLVSFGVACQKNLMHYYHHFRVEPVHEDVDAFFLSIDGYPMTASAVKSVIKRLAKSSGITRLHPHLLRHTYATMFLLNGGDTFLLKQNPGHTTLAMVQNYLHIASQTAVVRSQQFSPLDRMNRNDNRRFRHSFAGNGSMNGRIYPNGGKLRAKRKRSRSGMKRSAR